MVSDEISIGTELVEAPDVSVDTLYEVDKVLSHYFNSADRAYKRMRKIPKEQREDWYDKNVLYWKHVRSALKWVMRSNQEKIRYATDQHKHSPETANTPVSSGRDS